MEIKERTQGIKKKLSHGRLKVTRHCLPDFPDISSLSDLLLQPTVIRRVTRLRGICLESVLSANLCASRGGSEYVKCYRYVI
ncbi:hypothetical protein ACSBR2_030735 [Camellia fascicularis]